MSHKSHSHWRIIAGHVISLPYLISLCVLNVWEATGQADQQEHYIVSLVKQVMKESLQEFARNLARPGTSSLFFESLNSCKRVQPEEPASSISEEEEEETSASFFDFSLIDAYI